MSKTAVIYARVSTDEQANNYSLPTQLEACRQLAHLKGYTILEEFQEDYTGTKLQRPEFDKVQALVEAGKVQVVITHDVDRLARKLAHQIIIEEHFTKRGAALEFALADYADTPEGKLQKHIKGVIAEYEREKILERTKRGRVGKIQAGNISCGRFARYGYTYVTDGNKSRYEPDPVEAEVVVLIFFLFVVERLNRPEIARRLKALCIPTTHDIEQKESKDKKKRDMYCWDPAVIWRILTDETYTGVWHYGKHKRVDGKRVRTARSEWIPVSVPQIITPEVFAAAQERIAENRKYAPRRTTQEYLVRGRMICSCCGSRYGGKTRTYPASDKYKKTYVYQYYTCQGIEKARGKDLETKSCRGSLQVAGVDQVVWNTVKAFLKQPDSMLLGLRERQVETNERRDRITEQRAILRERIESNNREVEQYVRLYGKRNLSEEMLDKMVGDLNYEIASCQTEIMRLDNELASLRIDENDIAAIARYCRDIQAGIEQFAFAEKRAVLDALDVTIEVTRTEGVKRGASLKIAGCFSEMGIIPLEATDTDSVLSVANDTPIAIGKS